MKLTEQQVLYIRSYVASHGITMESLQDDVVDHLCCMLEVNEGVDATDFEVRVQHAVEGLTSRGLHQIEKETVLLLTSKILRMKKIMYTAGLVSAMAASMGICLKTLHMQGGDPLLTYGLLTFTLLFLPMIVIDHFKENLKSTADKIKLLMGMGSAVFTGLAIVLRLLRISDADMLFVSGMALFSFGFLPFVFFSLYKKSVAS